LDIRLDTVLARLDRQCLKYAFLNIGKAYDVLVTERWGRCLGPFGREGRSFLWLNPDIWESDESFGRALAGGLWNVGGERFWVAPEIRLNIKDRTNFLGSYELPAAMDPGSWKLESCADRLSLSMSAELNLYNPAGGKLRYAVERSISPSPNPLASLRSFNGLMSGVEYAGYMHRIRFSLLPGSDVGACAEAWALCQLVPDGTIIVPCADGVEYEDYFEKADAACMTIGGGAVRFTLTGKRRYKVGLRSAHLFGRAGYLRTAGLGLSNADGSGMADLFVRNYPNDPSSEYIEEPDFLPSCRGLSFHVYNDGGVFGGFGELECNGRTIGGKAGRESTDDFSFWYFRGPTDSIRGISKALLGRS
jgi:hypothetical protein